MKKEELQRKIRIEWKGYSSYKITIEYRGKDYNCISNNSLAYDSWLIGGGEYTEKQALMAFWNECKRKNNLY